MAKGAFNLSDETGQLYPHSLNCGGGITVRVMTAADASAALAFARDLPSHDLLFLPRDITQSKVIDAWVHENDRGAMTSLLALDGHQVVGCATIASDPLSWSSHVAELRVVVAPQSRGHGIGRALTQEIFGLALRLSKQKLIAQMTADQHGAIAVFEGMGFRPEALLRGHVQGPDGLKKDIVIFALDVDEGHARLMALGMP
jgi:RimJ/RimL family protein N-acetyltransferase